jgi:ribonuclease HII
MAVLFMEMARLALLAAPERELARRGFRRVAGVDEVGRGCLAGPVVAAAVVLPVDSFWPGIDDSKKLDADEREALAAVIRATAVAFAVASVPASEIDDSHIGEASLRAMRNAVENLAPAPDAVLVDAFRIPGLAIPQVPLVHGDARSVSIAAASIVAKVERDARMDALSRLYPAYAFERHKGYAVAEHRDAIARYGPCPEHRLSFHGVVPSGGDR